MTERYTGKCICPCSNLFWNWHKKNHIGMLPDFKVCSSSIFDDYTTFVKHLYFNHSDYYHRIVLRMVQSSYSTLISKIKISSHPDSNRAGSFGSIHTGKVALLPYMSTTSNYQTFSFEKNGCTVTLVKTNLLESVPTRDMFHTSQSLLFKRHWRSWQCAGNIIKQRKGVLTCIVTGVLSLVLATQKFLLMVGLRYFQGHTSLLNQIKKDQSFWIHHGWELFLSRWNIMCRTSGMVCW